MQRVERLQRAMRHAGLDALICRLPENVVLVSDVWPHHGVSVAWLPASGTPTLFTPEIERPYAMAGWAEVEAFAWGLANDDDEYRSYRRVLRDAAATLGAPRPRIGVERGFDSVGASYRVAEPVVPGGAWEAALAGALPSAELVDAAPLLERARARKGDYEIERIKRSISIAEMGIRAGLRSVRPGATEAQVAAAIEHAIRADGPGHDGVRLARGTADVSAGADGSAGAFLLVPSTPRALQAGDLVVIELATVADGYWSDLTYTTTVGDPTPKQRERYNVVLAAQRLALQAIRPGAAARAADQAARSHIAAAGLAAFFPHGTGHGLGFRYHESAPMLLPSSEDVFEEGMVTSVEPGIYERGFGGIRIEDDVLVAAEGGVSLSTPRQPW